MEDITNKIENKVSERLEDAELEQQEILRLNESLSSKLGILAGNLSQLRPCTSNREVISREGFMAENSRDLGILIGLAQRTRYDMVTGVPSEPRTSNHVRSSSLPQPNERHSDEIIDKVLESLRNTSKQSTGRPCLRKALAATTPTFDRRIEKVGAF